MITPISYYALPDFGGGIFYAELLILVDPNYKGDKSLSTLHLIKDMVAISNTINMAILRPCIFRYTHDL